MSKQCLKPRNPKECAEKLPQVIRYVETQREVPVEIRQMGGSHVKMTATIPGTNPPKKTTMIAPDHSTGLGLGLKIFKWLASIGLVAYLFFQVREFILTNVVDGLVF